MEADGLPIFRPAEGISQPSSPGDDVAGRRVPTIVELIAHFMRRCDASSTNAKCQQRRRQREP